MIGTDVLKQTEFKISANGIELIPKKKNHFINLTNVSKAHNQSELKGLLITFWIFFHCGQLIFRMADCEVEGAIASPRSIAPADSFERKRQGNVPDGKRSNKRRNMRTTEYV
ncbi:hypothetical protein TNCV_2569371 [Trichonephila clavipes]|nr:hypothetical protein TNCV_2569371 [Trichonephila clavipes]